MTISAAAAASSSSLSSRVGCMEEVVTISGLIGVQLILAVYTLYIHTFLSRGVDSLFLVIFGGFAAALLLLPFALVLEKKKWPARLRPVLMIQMLAVAGVAFQALILFGNKMTSPAIASAMPNLAPVFIFIIAACVRFEKFSIWCKFSRAKVLGTILCLGGAISMSFLMNPQNSPKSTMKFGDLPTSISMNLAVSVSKEWILGCFYLLSAVVFLSCAIVLQAVTMVNFPAPFSLCVVTTLMGSIITIVWQYVMEGKLNIGTSNLSLATIIFFVLSGAVVTSATLGFQSWCIRKKGPVMVSIFNPIQTVFSAVLSAFILGQVLSLGSLAGMLLMFVGLYIVLWAKKKEDCVIKDDGGDDQKLILDVEKPLLV